jgi:uncharacterized damage-inducible protein DinB
MDIGIKLLVDLSNQECVAGSLNGPALIESLRSLSSADASSNATYEGYTAWGVALHVLYFKYLVAKRLGAAIVYEHEKTDFPALPEDRDEAAWNNVIDEIESAQKSFIEVLANATEADLNSTFEEWKMPIGAAVAWLISHDISHNAQIRNMGIESLKQPTQ